MADKDPTEVYLKDVRLSYPHLFERQKATPDAKPKFSANFLIDPNTEVGKENLKKVKRAMDAACRKAFGKPFSEMHFKANRLALKDGNEQIDADGNVKAGYENMWVVSASNPNPITVLNRQKQRVDAESSPFYGGCYVEAIVRFYGTKQGGAPGIFASLEGVRFWRDGERFGAAPVDPDMFDDAEDSFDFEDDDEIPF